MMPQASLNECACCYARAIQSSAVRHSIERSHQRSTSKASNVALQGKSCPVLHFIIQISFGLGLLATLRTTHETPRKSISRKRGLWKPWVLKKRISECHSSENVALDPKPDRTRRPASVPTSDPTPTSDPDPTRPRDPASSLGPGPGPGPGPRLGTPPRP